MTQQLTTVAATPAVGVEGLDKAYIHMIISWLRRVDSNQTLDYSSPFVWPSLRGIFPLFFLLNACVAIIGSASNFLLLVALYRRRRQVTERRQQRCDPSDLLLANLALSDLIKAAIVLPLTFANLALANWVYGSALCFLLPMMHSLPVHASLLTHVVIAIDRYRMIVAAPMRLPVPARACVAATWFVAGLAVMPYVVYVKYIDLGATLGSLFDGVGICCVNQQRDVKQYVRAAFVCMYCVPLAVVTCLYVRISIELKRNIALNRLIDIDSKDTRITNANCTTKAMSDDAERTTKSARSHRKSVGTNNAESRYGIIDSTKRRQMKKDSDGDGDEDEDIDARRETRTQGYLTCMIVAFAMFWCPLEIMMLVTHFIYENDKNSGHFDITYLLLTLCGYLSTCINAPLFASWQMSKTTRERLRGYLRLSNRNCCGSLEPNIASV